MTGRPTKSSRLNRRAAVVLVLGAGLGLLGLGAVPWVRGSANIPGAALEQISSSGGQAAPLVPAVGLVLLAAAVALALARKIGTIITCLITALAGVATTVASVVVLNDPGAAMTSQVTEVTAIVLPTEAIHDVGITIWVAAASVFGVVIVGIAALIWRAAPGWQTDTRHEKVTPSASGQAVAGDEEIRDADLWDLLSDGQDPTP